jgi:hypothetical protein
MARRLKNPFSAYPIENRCPAFHGDALKDGEHGEPDVVERRDPEVGPLPLFEADRDVGLAGVGAGRSLRGVVGMTRNLSGVAIIKTGFSSMLTSRPNKLERLSLETLSSQVLEFEGKARANPIGAPFRYFLLG